jgi:hypothetical protein
MEDDLTSWYAFLEDAEKQQGKLNEKQRRQLYAQEILRSSGSYGSLRCTRGVVRCRSSVLARVLGLLLALV